MEQLDEVIGPAALEARKVKSEIRKPKSGASVENDKNTSRDSKGSGNDQDREATHKEGEADDGRRAQRRKNTAPVVRDLGPNRGRK